MVAKRIKKLRMARGLNQTELADLINVSPSTVGMYEQGRRYPNIEMLIMLARVFDVSLDYLITGTEYPESLAHMPERYTPPKITHETCPCSTCYWRKYKNT